jgi:hypothetical protein
MPGQASTNTQIKGVVDHRESRVEPAQESIHGFTNEQSVGSDGEHI